MAAYAAVYASLIVKSVSFLCCSIQALTLAFLVIALSVTLRPPYNFWSLFGMSLAYHSDCRMTQLSIQCSWFKRNFPQLCSALYFYLILTQSHFVHYFWLDHSTKDTNRTFNSVRTSHLKNNFTIKCFMIEFKDRDREALVMQDYNMISRRDQQSTYGNLCHICCS